ncbi:MAG: glycoside hydrolase family 2 TIM barrel-domain containing protein [Paludibacteraceae bacterium]
MKTKNRAMRNFILYTFLIVANISFLNAASIKISMNSNWLFSKDNSTWETVQIPHSWNNMDVMDDAPGYYRNVCTYKRTFVADERFKENEVYLLFEGANQVAEVYVNGKHVKRHIGGYSAFTVSMKGLLKFGDKNQNELVVKIDNSYNKNIPPLSADFTFLGGLYRDVYLIVKNPVHFSPLDFSSEGVYISTPSVSKDKATIQIKAIVRNMQKNSKLVLFTTLYDNQGKIVSKNETKFSMLQNTEMTFLQNLPAIISPNLWSPENPYLYSAVTQILDNKGNVLDEIVNPVGFRWFRFDPESGFYLNDKHYKLIGTSRHQDFKLKGNGLEDDYAIKDVELLKKMGGNFLRIAHYPQDKSVLQACDRLGILCSIEIPLINEITESKEFEDISVIMLMEMLRQYYNHPSLVIWCYMNEILLKDKYDDNALKQKEYHKTIYNLAEKLENIIRKEDPSRYTMHASHGAYSKYKEAGLLNLPMIVGWNLYNGWYGGEFEGFAKFIDRFHIDFPDKITAITEYGADNDPRIRSNNPVRFDKSTEYATLYHQAYYKTIKERPWVSAGMIWNLTDFSSETRMETMPHINNKGILTWDRNLKDQYVFYQTQLSKKPEIKILNYGWKIRTGIAENRKNTSGQPISVASNLENQDVELIHNGKSLGTKRIIDGLAKWDVPFENGFNTFVAKGNKEGQQVQDDATVNFIMQPYNLEDRNLPFEKINVLLGSTRYYMEPETKEIWLPDQPYREGSFGHIGGKPYKFNSNGRTPFGTDKAINNTDDDPIFQTQQVGIQEYKFDVSPGMYELTLCFAELEGGQAIALAYNLQDQKDRIEKLPTRVFDVFVNNDLILQNFNIGKQYGLTNAVKIKIPVHVTGSGITIKFNKKENEPVLNALKLRKTY